MMDTKKLRQKILDLAIRGKLVPQDPNDEPAGVLLQRIREEKERLVKEGKIKRSKTSATNNDIEPPFEIPESWEWCRLENLVSPDCTLGYGIVQPMDVVPNGIPVVRPVDLISPIIGINGLKRIDEKISNSYQRTILKGGEILFCVRASVGKVGIASSQLKDANVTRGISPLRFDFKYLTKYVFFHLQSLFSQTEIKSYSRGATLQQINVEDLKLLLIAVPPLAEQQRIANEIERWFAAIDELESNEADLQKTIDKAKSKILDLAIHGKLVPQDPNDEPAIELLKRINPKFEACENESGAMPVGWTTAKMQDVCKIIMGSSPSGEEINTVGNGVEFHQGKLNFTNLYVEHSDSYTTSVTKLAPENSLLLCVRAPVGTVNITPREICIGRGLCSLAPKGEMSLLFLFYALQTYQSYFEVNATGSTFKAISGDIVKQCVLRTPPLAEQKRIVAKIEELFAVLDSISAMTKERQNKILSTVQ